jgi:glycosyltransferase involved in cell wall biosynthesis
MKKLTVWLLQTGEPLHVDDGSPRPMRAMNLSNALVEAGHRVVLWSTAFNHQTKKHRSKKFEQITLSEKLEIRLVPSPGYHANIGLGRLWDHAILARNLSKLIDLESDLPDVAFIGYPPIETAVVMINYLSSKQIPTILDIKDQWPSLFLDPLPEILHPLGRLILYPYYFLAKQAMLQATCISTMAEGYLDWCTRFSGRNENFNDRVFPLTSPQGNCSEQDLIMARKWWDEQGVKYDPSITRIIFVGSHMSIFDFEPIRTAANSCLTESIPVEFIICGDGGSSQQIRKSMINLSNVYFPGWIDRPKIEVLAERSQASIAPYRNISNFVDNLPNKVLDSLALGLPILSPLKGEVFKLINTYKVGFSYSLNTEDSLLNKIKLLVNDSVLSLEMRENAKHLYTHFFEYNHVYNRFVSHIESLSISR